MYDDVLAAADETREQLSATVVATIAVCGDTAWCGVSVDPNSDTYDAHVTLLEALEGMVEQMRSTLAQLPGAQTDDSRER